MDHSSAERHRRHYIVMLARSYLAYGTPSHRIETQLASAAKALDIHADFLLIPNTIFACFYDPNERRQASMHVIKVVGRLSLAAVEDAWSIYQDVNSSRITAEVGAERLKDIEDREEAQKKRYRCVIAFLCGFAVTPLAFDGSFADALVGGACAAGSVLIAEYFAARNVLVEKLFEVFVAFFISFIARFLYSQWDHRFCYSAVASGGIVLILPGFTVMCASLELSHKKMLTGSIKLVYAIFFALILAFVQTSGSDLYLKFNSNAVAARAKMIQSITETNYLSGTLVANGTLNIANLTLGFTQALDPDRSYPEWKYKGTGCYRDPGWIWVFQKPTLGYFFLIVPAFAFFLTLWNGMPIKFKWRNTEHVIMMILLACGSYTANLVGTTYLTGSIGSSLGAFVVSFLGSIYTRLRKDITPFVLMTPGILLLVPTGLTAVGGLSKNYTGEDDQFSTVLNTGFAMVELSIGIIVGLSLASLLANLDEVWRSAVGRSKTEKVAIAF
ncbi:uncharacterized protein EI90DRAFT_2911443 [Cantharellus anzutake]|uniref:uncharacterized protein n=1 Tax=Cantharellus anzutake TaxID=1750568 RepID=UPI001908FC85|nr:uncharacterized protein EI90DRAFT_2911443 [Cantharellus anzutake]KAF8336510.1 hypothetical protein EI90DRAFT_2911443 [Cantharellus anzutake]